MEAVQLNRLARAWVAEEAEEAQLTRSHLSVVVVAEEVLRKKLRRWTQWQRGEIWALEAGEAPFVCLLERAAEPFLLWELRVVPAWQRRLDRHVCRQNP